MSKLLQGLFVGLIKVLALLPLGAARGTGRVLTRINRAFFSPTGLRITGINIDLCYPALSVSERRELSNASYRHFGELAGESGAVWLWQPDRVLGLVTQVHGEQFLLDAIARNDGVVAIIPHLGNWEVVGLYLASLHHTTSLYDPPEYPALDELMHTSRSRNGANLVPTNQRGVAALLKALRAGHLTAILPDQVPRDSGSAELAPFFGHPAVTMSLVSRLLSKTKASALFLTAIRTPQGFEIHIQEPAEALFSENILESLTALNQGVEKLIALAPAQYSWEYKRFRPVPKNDDLNPYLKHSRRPTPADDSQP